MAPRPLPFFLRMPRWALVAASIAIMFMGAVFAGVVVEHVISSAKEEAATSDVPESEAPQETLVADAGTDDSYAPQDAVLEEVSESAQTGIAEAISTTKTETSNNTPSASTQENGENDKMSIRKTISALAAAFTFATGSAQATDDWTVSENFTLTEDMSVGALTVESGVTLDLNGYKLTCTSLDGSGTITSLATGADLTDPDGTCTMPSPSATQSGAVAALFDNKGQNSYSTSHRVLLNLGNNNQNLGNNNQKLSFRVDYDFGDGNAKAMNTYKIWAAWRERAPKAWTLYGSNNDSAYGASSDVDWVVIDSHSGETSWTQGSSNITPEDRTYFCGNSTAYRYYRLKVTERVGSNNYFELVQLEYFSAPPGELHLNVASGSVAWPSSITFSGNVKVVKEGEGKLAATGDLNIYDGTLVIKSGAVTVGGIMRIGYASGKTAAVEIDGGTLTLNYNGNSGSALVVGDKGMGTLTVNDGTVTVTSKDAYFAWNEGASGTINLNGGTLVTRRLLTNNGSSRTLNFNGGTLKANSAVQLYGLIADGVTVNVGENGGMIDSGNLSDATSGSRVFVAAALGQPGNTGAMTFKGGKTINIEGIVNCGTVVELGTRVVASKAILDNGFVVDGRSTIEDKDYDVLVASGLTAADLEKVSLVNCASGSTRALDDAGNPTKIVASLVAVSGVGTDTPVLVFPDTTLQKIKYAKFTTRMFGKYVAAEYNVLHAVDGYNTKLYYDDNDDLQSIVVEFQYLESGTTRIRCVVVEFTDDGNDVYAKALGARYNPNASLGYEFLKQDKTWQGELKTVATSRTAIDYGVCDIRWMEGDATVWVLDSDKNWSDFSGYDSLSSDDAVLIEATYDYTLTVDVDATAKSIEFINASGSTLSVASGKTLMVEDVAGIGNILNNGTIVKMGDGTATWPFDNGSTGVTIISNGTLKVAGVKTVAGSPYAFVSDENPHANQLIDVVEGATFDLNGINDLTASVRLADGAYFVNSRADIPDNQMQTVQIILTGNATVTATKQFGLLAPAHRATRLDLGSYTLTLNGSSNFWLDNTTIYGDGTIAVNSGTLSVTQQDSAGEDCTLIIGASGKLTLANDKTLTVKNFTNRGNATGGGTGWLTVTGTLTPGNEIKRVTLADGSTVNASATTTQRISYGFSVPGTVTIDASEITKEQLSAAVEQRIPVLTVPTANRGGDWIVANPPVTCVRAKWVDNGDDTSTLYLCRSHGTIFIIK